MTSLVSLIHICHFSITSACLALLGLTRHISPALQGFQFPLQQGYLVEGLSLTNDVFVLCTGQKRSCKHYSRSGQQSSVKSLASNLLCLWRELCEE